MNEPIPAIVSVSQMAMLMQMSRARLYQLIDEGVLLPPVRPQNHRPYYLKDRAMANIDVRKTCMGMNGKPVLFYQTRKHDSIIKGRNV